MKKWATGVAIILAVLMVSCTNPYQKELETVEEMQQVLMGAKQSYAQVDIDKVKFAFDTYKKNINQIQKYYKPDSIATDVSNLINFYKGIKHSAKGFSDDYKAVGMQIEFIETQLATLKTDIENQAEFHDSLSLFIENQQNNIENLNKDMGTLLYNYDFVVSTHDSISSKVQNILLENVE